MLFLCQLSFLFIFLRSSSPVGNDLSEVSINNPLAMSSVFVLALFLRAIDKFSLIKFASILYFSLSILLSFKLLTLLKSFCL